MPGRQVKNWSQYHKLRRKGFSRTSAARITNSKSRRRKSRKKRATRRRSRH